MEQIDFDRRRLRLGWFSEETQPDAEMFVRVLETGRLVGSLREDGRHAVVRSRRRPRLPTSAFRGNPTNRAETDRVEGHERKYEAEHAVDAGFARVRS